MSQLGIFRKSSNSNTQEGNPAPRSPISLDYIEKPNPPFFSLPPEIREWILFFLLTLSGFFQEPSFPNCPSHIVPLGYFSNDQNLNYLLVSHSFSHEILQVFSTRFRHRLQAYRPWHDPMTSNCSPILTGCFPTFMTHNHSRIRHLDILVYSLPDSALERPKLSICSSLNVNDVLSLLPYVRTLRVDLTLIWQWQKWSTDDAKQYCQLLRSELEHSGDRVKTMVHVRLAEAEAEEEEDENNVEQAVDLLEEVKKVLLASSVTLMNDRWDDRTTRRSVSRRESLEDLETPEDVEGSDNPEKPESPKFPESPENPEYLELLKSLQNPENSEDADHAENAEDLESPGEEISEDSPIPVSAQAGENLIHEPHVLRASAKEVQLQDSR